MLAWPRTRDNRKKAILTSQRSGRTVAHLHAHAHVHAHVSGNPNTVRGSRLLRGSPRASRSCSKSAAEEHERPGDFQAWADSLVRSAPHEQRGEEELERKHHGRADARSPRTEKKHKVDTRPRRTGQNAPSGFSEKGTQKAETSKVPDMGLDQKGKTVEAKSKFPIWGSNP